MSGGRLTLARLAGGLPVDFLPRLLAISHPVN